MAPKTQMPVPTEECDVENSSSEGESPAPSMRRRGLLALATVGALAFVALAAGSRKHSTPLAPRSLTVRTLLESDELAEVAVRNLVALGGVQRADGMPMEHGELKGQVLDSFKNIHAFISERDPESARQLEALPISEDEKTDAMERLSYYSNPLLVKLTKEITAAYIKHHGQMHEEMLTTVLANTGDLQSIARTLFPVDRASHGPVVMPVSDDMVQRRLHAKLDTVSGSMPQARSLLEGLECRLGDKMPKAPSRLLLDFMTSPTPSGLGSTPTSSSSAGFMACLEKAMPNPTEVVSCIASNFESVVQMMMSFMKSHAPTR